jgi:hypothetical protein
MGTSRGVGREQKRHRSLNRSSSSSSQAPRLQASLKGGRGPTSSPLARAARAEAGCVPAFRPGVRRRIERESCTHNVDDAPRRARWARHDDLHWQHCQFEDFRRLSGTISGAPRGKLGAVDDCSTKTVAITWWIGGVDGEAKRSPLSLSNLETPPMKRTRTLTLVSLGLACAGYGVACGSGETATFNDGLGGFAGIGGAAGAGGNSGSGG